MVEANSPFLRLCLFPNPNFGQRTRTKTGRKRIRYKVGKELNYCRDSMLRMLPLSTINVWSCVIYWDTGYRLHPHTNTTDVLLY